MWTLRSSRMPVTTRCKKRRFTSLRSLSDFLTLIAEFFRTTTLETEVEIKLFVKS